MKYNRLTNTDIELSAITLGTWVFGGESWSGSKEDDCISAVHCAIDCGINCVDTAPIYSHGASEEIVGKALLGRRDKMVLTTKCGLIAKGKSYKIDLSKESILSEIDDSLKRLKTDYIDLYQCHWPDKNTDLKETIETLLFLKKKEKIKHIGLSNFTSDQVNEALKYCDITSLQSQYSIIDRKNEHSELKYCNEKNISYLAYGPLAGGILTGKYLKSHSFPKNDCRRFFYKYYEGDGYSQVSQLLKKFNSYNKPLGELALNWVRQTPGVTSTLVGCRNSEQVMNNVASISWDLTHDQYNEISELGLLDGQY